MPMLPQTSTHQGYCVVDTGGHTPMWEDGGEKWNKLLMNTYTRNGQKERIKMTRLEKSKQEANLWWISTSVLSFFPPLAGRGKRRGAIKLARKVLHFQLVR